jgi:hypothetical protein
MERWRWSGVTWRGGGVGTSKERASERTPTASLAAASGGRREWISLDTEGEDKAKAGKKIWKPTDVT